MVKEDSIAVEKRGLAERHILISENSFTGLCKAAREGNVQAQYKLGKCYYFGLGVAINYKEAAKWYHKAAMQKNIMAQYSLSLCYQCGHGVKKDSTEAFKWGQMAHAGFQKAAEIGNIWAQIHLCFLYNESDKWSSVVIEKLRNAAEQGDVDSQYWLAWVYKNIE